MSLSIDSCWWSPYTDLLLCLGVGLVSAEQVQRGLAGEVPPPGGGPSHRAGATAGQADGRRPPLPQGKGLPGVLQPPPRQRHPAERRRQVSRWFASAGVFSDANFSRMSSCMQISPPLLKEAAHFQNLRILVIRFWFYLSLEVI